MTIAGGINMQASCLVERIKRRPDDNAGRLSARPLLRQRHFVRGKDGSKRPVKRLPTRPMRGRPAKTPWRWQNMWFGDQDQCKEG